MINIYLSGYFITNEEHKSYIEALEKQKPKKPNIIEVHPTNILECPICECALIIDKRWKYCYCSHCGQKIDFKRGELDD